MRDNLCVAFCRVVKPRLTNVYVLFHTPISCATKRDGGDGQPMNTSQLMQRALVLSEMGYGETFPNPIVGAVITDATGQIIGEGYHCRQKSIDHAEVVAIKSAARSTTGGTIHVTLEPCNHTGATAPCTDAIIAAQLAKVVIATRDPNPIAGGGVERLRSAGIKVEVDVLTAEVEFSNRSWLHKIKTGRPRIIWKVAQSADGKIATGDGSPTWISSEESRADVQIIRAQSDAIVIGTGTALADNPHLVPRNLSESKNPDRIVVGMREIPKDFNLYDQAAHSFFIKSRDLETLVAELKRHGYNQVLLECGPTLGGALFEAGLIDELILYTSPQILGSDGVTLFENPNVIFENLQLISKSDIGPDKKSHYFVVKNGG
jgi:diaminohydroxyphosphoribosylaminopyrimidine deaminase/5-amino-6-(5-phosphoribosylamino)uracil reductase